MRWYGLTCWSRHWLSDQRQTQREGGAFAGRAGDVQRAVMALHDPLRAGQTDTGAADAADDVAAAAEQLEDVGQILGRDAQTLVADDHRRPLLVGRHVDAYAAAVWAVLDGVPDQVVEHALEPSHVELTDKLRHGGVQHDLVARGCLGVLVDDVADQLEQIGRLERQVRLIV